MAKIALEGNASGTGTLTIKAPNTNTNNIFTLPDRSGTIALGEQTSVPIGSVIWVTGTTAPAGYIAANGQLLDRTAYADLWNYANASGNIVADTSWTKGNYSYGNGTTTFRVPDLRDQFIRGASSTRPVGNGEEDAFQGHRHDATPDGKTLRPFTTTSGSSASVSGSIQSNYYYNSTGDPIADTINGTPRTSDETRPKNVALLPCIRAYDTLTDASVLLAGDVVSQVNDLENSKLDAAEIVAPGDAPMFTCRAWVYFDGTTIPPTIRASGNVSSVVRNGTGNYTVNMVTPAPTLNYTVCTARTDDTATLTRTNGVGVLATSSFVLYTKQGTALIDSSAVHAAVLY